MNRQAVARWEELREGAGKVVHAGGVAIGLFVVAGELRAFRDYCPHAGAPLTGGRIENGVLTCPWHGWQFDLRTGAHVVNPRCTLDVCRVEVIEGTVFVWV